MPVRWMCIVENVHRKVYDAVRRILVGQNILIYRALVELTLYSLRSGEVVAAQIAFANGEKVYQNQHADQRRGGARCGTSYSVFLL